MEKNVKTIHPFPARMAPSIAWKHLISTKKFKILDPMVGSGTTTTIARLLGHEAYGIDSDPLATIISTAWSSNLDSSKFRLTAERILNSSISACKTIRSADAYPKGCDAETKKFIKYWFDTQNRKQLTCLSSNIGRVRDKSIRNYLWTAFSKMIIGKKVGVSLAIDISHSRPHKVYSKAPCQAFDIFLKSVESIITNAPFKEKPLLCQPMSRVIRGDSRNIPYPEAYFDVIITSPPYLNAIDYFRFSKLSLVWMGHSTNDIKKWRSNNIGSEVMIEESSQKHIKKACSKLGDISKLPSREKGFTFRYLIEMDKVIKEISRVSKHNGKTIMVIGNSTLKNVYIKNSDALADLASNYNLKLSKKSVRKIPDNRRYLPSPSHEKSGHLMNKRIRKEVVLEFIKI